MQHTPKFDRSSKQIKEYLSQVQYECDELNSDYGYHFLVVGSGSGFLVAHILFDKIPDETKAELIRRSSTPYPSLGCILQYSNNVIKALLQVQPTLTPRMDSIQYFRPKTNPAWTKNAPKVSALESFHTDHDIVDNVHYCNSCTRNGYASLNCKTYRPSYNDCLRCCRQLGLCEFCTVTSHDGGTCPGVKGFRDPCKSCNSWRHFTSMCLHFKLDESEINTSINTKIEDTQNILPVVNITITRGNYPVSLNCLIVRDHIFLRKC